MIFLLQVSVAMGGKVCFLLVDAPNIASNSTTNHGNLQGFLCSLLAIFGASTVSPGYPQE